MSLVRLSSFEGEEGFFAPEQPGRRSVKHLKDPQTPFPLPPSYPVYFVAIVYFVTYSVTTGKNNIVLMQYISLAESFWLVTNKRQLENSTHTSDPYSIFENIHTHTPTPKTKRRGKCIVVHN